LLSLFLFDLLHSIFRNDDGAQPHENIGTITIYKNGFQIGKGEFRDTKDPKNVKYLEEIKEGYVFN
jgi:hypothetical protein